MKNNKSMYLKKSSGVLFIVFFTLFVFTVLLDGDVVQNFKYRDILGLISNICLVLIPVCGYIYIISTDIYNNKFHLSKYLIYTLLIISTILFLAGKFYRHLYGLYSIYLFLISVFHIIIVFLTRKLLKANNVDFKYMLVYLAIILILYIIDFTIAAIIY